MVWPLVERQGSSPLQSHNSWLMCEVALSKRQQLKHCSRSAMPKIFLQDILA